MGRALFDTNILIDYIRGLEAARLEMERYDSRAISVMTWIEIMMGVLPAEDEGIRKLLARFELLGVTPQVQERSVLLRRQRRIKLPDAILLATARLLVTRNTRDFSEEAGLVRVPYRI